MKNKLQALFLAAASGLATPPCKAADNLVGNMVKSYRASTVYIVAKKETKSGEIIEEYGSGFIVTNDGYVLTSCHTVNRLILDDKGRDTGKLVESVDIKGAVGSREESLEKVGFVACAQPPIDLALLKFANTFKPRAGIPIDRAASLSMGDVVASMGYPLDVEFFPRRGTLGASTSDGTYNVDMTMTPGDSGAPVFNEHLSVIGVAEGGYAGTQIGFIRPIRHAAGLLTLANIEITATNANISSAPKVNAPEGSKVEVATSVEAALASFSDAGGHMPDSPAGEVKVTYPLLELLGKDTPTHRGASANPSIAVNEVKAKPGYKIIDAKFIALSEQNAKVVSVNPVSNGAGARTAIVADPPPLGASQPASGTIRGFIETIQVPQAAALLSPQYPK